MAHDVFVSYSSKDKAIADSIVAALEERQIRCWYAPRDIEPGDDWGDAIAAAIGESPIFLLVFSGNANRSRRVLDELNLAVSRECAILPFRIEQLEPSGAMLLHLSSRHWLDAFSPRWRDYIGLLADRVSAILGDPSTNSPRHSASVTGRRRSIRVAGVALAAVAAGAALVWALSGRDSTAAATTTTARPTITTTTLGAPALGTADNPIVWMYTPPPNIGISEANATARDIAARFSEMSVVVTPVPAIDRTAIVDALCDGGADIGSLGPFSYLMASEQACGEARLIWEAYGAIDFGGMVVVRADSGLATLEDLEGLRLCIPEYSSTSGWLLPSLEIRALIGDPTTFFGEIRESGNHDEVLVEVDTGVCDAGTAYYDARANSGVPGLEDRLTIVMTTDVVPQQNLTFGPSIPEALAGDLADLFVEISVDSDGFARFAGISDSPVPPELVQINDYYYDRLRELLESAGAEPSEFLSAD